MRKPCSPRSRSYWPRRSALSRKSSASRMASSAGAPLLAVGERLAEHRQAVGFEIAVRWRALIGDIGRGRGAIEQQRFFAVVARADLQHGARQAQPVRCIGGCDGDELAEHVMPVRKSFFWKAASASRRSVAAGLVTAPASFLICASSLMAASSRSLRLKALSAAIAGRMARAMSAAARPARTDVNIEEASQCGDRSS